jgi:SOS response regulatory protein OraA/RecX
VAGGGGSLNGRAIDLAYRYVSRRERTVSELRQHLLRREVDEASAAETIEELVEQGSLDDARFARLFVQDKRELQQWGSERIRRALLARGIDRELVDAALGEDEPGDGGDLDRALALLRQRFRSPRKGEESESERSACCYARATSRILRSRCSAPTAAIRSRAGLARVVRAARASTPSPVRPRSRSAPEAPLRRC